jgi:diguanylate cyclase (GGDEF)-like protein
VFFDLDGFKAINDRIGHMGGDALLREIAGATAEHLSGAYAIGRVGGDEFAAAVPVIDADDAERVSGELGAAITSITAITIGHAVYPEDGEDLAALMEVADRRTYALKRPDPDPAGA